MKTFRWESAETGEAFEFPARTEVCSRCDGEGTHVNPSIDGNGITASEWAEEWDEDERDSYMRGVYDVTCEECEGRNVVTVIDEEAAEKAEPEGWALYLAEMRDLAQMRAEEAAERRKMGA